AVRARHHRTSRRLLGAIRIPAPDRLRPAYASRPLPHEGPLARPPLHHAPRPARPPARPPLRLAPPPAHPRARARLPPPPPPAPPDGPPDRPPLARPLPHAGRRGPPPLRRALPHEGPLDRPPLPQRLDTAHIESFMFLHPARRSASAPAGRPRAAQRGSVA